MNSPRITPRRTASIENPGIAPCAAAEKDSERIDDEVHTVSVVIGGNVVPEGEVELVVVDDVGLDISLSKIAAE